MRKRIRDLVTSILRGGRQPRTGPVGGQQATVADIHACFRLLLGREMGSIERAGHESLAGQELRAIVQSFLQSHEFSRRGLYSPVAFQRHELIDVNDVKVAIYPDDIDVGRGIATGAYEPHVTALFLREVKPGMRILDVGANCGYFTMLAARLVGPAGRVIAVEPNLENIRLLELGRRANGFANVALIPAAAGSCLGIATLHAAHSNGMTDALRDTVDVATVPLTCQLPLDAVADPVDLVKIDVEGQELDALMGFTLGLRERPRIVSEFSPPMLRATTGEAFLNFLFERGYKVGTLEADGTVSAFHTTAPPVMKAFETSGRGHIDVFGVPT